jgi:hypothetical protein
MTKKQSTMFYQLRHSLSREGNLNGTVQSRATHEGSPRPSRRGILAMGVKAARIPKGLVRGNRISHPSITLKMAIQYHEYPVARTAFSLSAHSPLVPGATPDSGLAMSTKKDVRAESPLLRKPSPKIYQGCWFSNLYPSV